MDGTSANAKALFERKPDNARTPFLGYTVLDGVDVTSQSLLTDPVNYRQTPPGDRVFSDACRGVRKKPQGRTS